MTQGENVVYFPAPQGSEDELALAFAADNKDKLRYVAEHGHWLQWQQGRWARDSTLHVYDMIREHVRFLTANDKSARQMAKAQVIAAVERLARSDRRIAATVDQWDTDHWILNTPEGIVDLHNGRLCDHDLRFYCTKITSVGPGIECPLWLGFLDRITAGSRDMQDFLQKFAGYALTGSTIEHMMGFIYGTGSNGKTVFLKTICGVMGDYAMSAQMELFMESKQEQHPTGLAGLQGARLVVAVETEEGRRWAEARIKSLTGGDRIRARFMKRDFFEFSPCFKLLISGNHLPGLRGVDEAIRRRMNLIPFEVKIPLEERDKNLEEKLRAEWPGILQWMIEGCLKWQTDGLNPPKIVYDATDHYLEAEDSFTLWLEEKCEQRATWQTSCNDLFSSWKDWAELAGEFAGSRKRFSQLLEARGFSSVRIGHAQSRGFKGILLKSHIEQGD